MFEPIKVLGDEPPKRNVGVGFLTKAVKGQTDPQRSDLEEFNEFMRGANRKIIEVLVSKGVCESPDERIAELKASENRRSSLACDDMFGALLEEPEKHQGRGICNRDLDIRTPVCSKIRSIPQYALYEWAKTVSSQVCYLGEMFIPHEGNAAVDDISPKLLENIGNSGFLCDGIVCTMKTPEWNAGVTKEELETMPKELAELYDGDVCGLSDVLEENPDPKYKLSWRACYGILRRAVNRGKKLPIELGYALVERIIEQAAFVKWMAMYGKNEVKKEGQISERQIAQIAFDDYVTIDVGWSDVTECQPVKGQDNADDQDDAEGLAGDEGEGEGNGADEE